MTAFTIFFCGTGSNRNDVTNKSYHQGELVSTLARNHLGEEFVDWIIVDGPGSGNLRADEMWRDGRNYEKGTAERNGYGWEENVDHAIAILDGKDPHYLNEQKKSHYIEKTESPLQGVSSVSGLFGKAKPVLAPVFTSRVAPQYTQRVNIALNRPTISCVNVIGWSRGAITCHMFANKLRKHRSLGQLAVRIFACDPVPGNGVTPSQHRIDLTGANVTDYIGIYSEDERSRFFSPVLPNLPGVCKTYITTMPGRHATLVGNSSLDGSGGAGVDGINGVTGPGQITRNIAESCLSYWGTNLGNRLHLSDYQCLQVYDQIMGQREIFLAMRDKSYVLSLTQSKSSRSIFLGNGACVNFESHHKLLRPTGFVNLHHRDLFQRFLPAAYDMVCDSDHMILDQDQLRKIGHLLQPKFPNLCAHWRKIGWIPK